LEKQDTTIKALVENFIKEDKKGALLDEFKELKPVTIFEVTTGPIVTSFWPESGAENVKLNTMGSITFSKSMDISTVTSNTSCTGTVLVSKDDFVTCIKFTGQPKVGNDNRTFTFIPLNNLEPNTMYKAKVSNGPKDTEGNVYNGTDLRFIPSFTTGTEIDNTPPLVTDFSPKAGAVDIDIKVNGYVTFNEAIDPTSLTVNTQDNICTGSFQVSKDDFSTCVMAESQPVPDKERKHFILKPKTAFEHGTIYKARLTNKVMDYAGNSYLGTASNAIPSFTTITALDTSKSYSITGIVRGLTGTVVINNNGIENLTITKNGYFTFTNAIASGESYNIKVLTNPSDQICTTSLNVGVVSDRDITNVDIRCSSNVFTVGGTISGLSGDVILQNNSGDELTLSADGSFTFSESIANQAGYNVSIKTNPEGQICTASNNSGTIAASNVTSVNIICSIDTYSVSFLVSGLSGTVILQNNATDNLPISSDGSFTFAQKIAYGGSYAVTILTQPSNKFCKVVNASGSISGSDIADVIVNCVDSPNFISLWRTTSANETITLPLRSGYNYNFTVDWGDASPISNITSATDPDITHTYAVAGDYTVTIVGTLEAWSFAYAGDRLKIIEVNDFGNMGWKDLYEAFYGCENLTTFAGGETASVTDMEYMFSYCSSLTSLDLSNFNTSNVTSMSSMFSYCSSLTNLDLSSFNTSAVTDMEMMFYDCSSLTSLDLSSFNTSAVTDMTAMFDNCSSLTNLDLSSFNTSAVTDMHYMFFGCSSLTSLDLSNFNTSNVTNMSFMFRYCSSLTSLDLSNFNTSAVTFMNSMFEGCSSLTSLDLSSFNTSTVTNMRGMFEGCNNLTNIDLSSFNTSAVTSMNYMFEGCSSLTSLDLSNFDTSNLNTMDKMFYDCSNLTSLNTSNWDITKASGSEDVFTGANVGIVVTCSIGTFFGKSCVSAP